MAESAYKARYGRKGELCGICSVRTDGPTTRLQLGYGVHVWLCREPASGAFHARRGGRSFTRTLQRVWTAQGFLDKRRAAALRAHQARLRAPAPRHKPGSYSWPMLRQECERRLATGEPLRAIEADIRRRHADQL